MSYIRIKRKRCEDPLPTVVVDKSGCERLRKRRNIMDAMKIVSVSKETQEKPPKRLVYKRLRTIEATEDRVKKRRKKEEVTKTLLEEKGFVRKPVAVLAPDEMEMDKAVWTAFQTGAFEAVFRLISHGTGSVNYQRRASDNTTALMASAHQGKLEIMKQLLDLGADPSLKSTLGHTAKDIATLRGHEKVVQYLDSFVFKKDDDDFVYDIYRVSDVAFDEAAIVKTSSASTDRYHGIVCGREVSELDDVEWEMGMHDGQQSDEDEFVDEYDSNAEDHFGNDYPDEDDENEGGNMSSSGYDDEQSSEDEGDWYSNT